MATIVAILIFNCVRDPLSACGLVGQFYKAKPVHFWRAAKGGYIFPFRKADSVSPASTVGGAVLVSDNGTRGVALGGEFYLKRNTCHVTTA